MRNRVFRFGPVSVNPSSSGPANILNPPALTGGVNGGSGSTYIVLTHLRLTNTTASPVTVSLWIGATAGQAAGTEFAFNVATVPANGSLDWYGNVRLDAADFLTGDQSGLTHSLSIVGEGEIGIA